MKIIFNVFLLIFSSQALAWECHELQIFPGVEEAFHDLEKILPKHPASDEEIIQAPCRMRGPPSAGAIKTYINKSLAGMGVDEKIHGVEFENESPQALKAFRELTTTMNSLGIIEWPQSQVAIQETYSINPACKKVRCAVSKIWGEAMGEKLLFMHQKYGFNGSEMAFNHSKRFNMEELDDVLMGIEDMPSFLHPISQNHRLSHFVPPATASASGKVIANAVIMLFDLWNQQSKPKKQYTVFHELSHLLSTKLNFIDRSPEWLNFSGWIKKGDEWKQDDKACFSSLYAATNPAEDWAEAISAYRYNAKTFKQLCPEKYQFIKSQVFKNHEYLPGSKACPK